MKLKITLLAAIALGLSATTHAQDKIYQSTGEVIEAKIKSIGVKTITYLRFDNQAGPEYTIEKAGVDKVVYQNGSEDKFENVMPGPHRMHHARRIVEGEEQQGPKLNYGRNVISLAPFQFSENGLGVGLSYERALDKNGYIAFYMPVIATWDLNSGTYVDPNGNTVNGKIDPMFYVMPGVKLYPTGSFGSVRYSVGPSIVVATGSKSSVVDNYSSPTSSYVSTSQITQSRFMLGLIINNSLNINPTPHIFLGMELGMGFTYLNKTAGLNQDTKFLAQGGFKIGYRF